MSPTSYQTAPSRVCVGAFYGLSSGCQSIFRKSVFLQMLSACPMLEFGAPGQAGGACSEIPVRKIIHIDCDCFYAALEMRDDPACAARRWRLAVRRTSAEWSPLAATRRGPMACARRWPCARRSSCVPISWWCARVSMSTGRCRQIHAIFRDYTDLIEPLSLDEAYLDVSASPHFAGSATRIARTSAAGWPRNCTSPFRRASRRTSSWPRSPATGASRTGCL